MAPARAGWANPRLRPTWQWPCSKNGNKVGILDADIYGPSIPIMFDVADQKPTLDPDAENGKIIPVEKYGIKIQSIGFFVDPEQALIWRGPMASPGTEPAVQRYPLGRTRLPGR